jgi:hypothetical protein
MLVLSGVFNTRILDATNYANQDYVIVIQILLNHLFSGGFNFREGVMIVKIKPANMKIFKGFSITTLPKTRILDFCKDTIQNDKNAK